MTVVSPNRVEPLASYADVLAALSAAEQAEGWLARCVEERRYLTLSAPFVDALADALRPFDKLRVTPSEVEGRLCSPLDSARGDPELVEGSGRRSPLLEICAGDGALAAALGRRGLAVTATDTAPPSQTEIPVESLTTAAALRRHRPRVVLGSFVPVDAGVDQQVLESPDVRHYVVLNAQLGGEYGATCLWTHRGWTRTPLRDVTRWMICRHDVWLGHETPPLTHGEAWLLSRTLDDETIRP